MTTPTTDPVPSPLPQNLLFNTEKLDEMLNSTALTFTDRTGVVRQTAKGIAAGLAAPAVETATYQNLLGSQAARGGAEAAQTGAVAAAAQANAAAAADYTLKTYAALAAITSPPNGTGAVVYGDAGTHTDPVVGGTVSNSGLFSKAAGGWQWISANTIDKKADQVDMASVRNRIYAKATAVGGTAAAVTLTVPDVTALVDGTCVSWVAGFDSTGAFTINVNGYGNFNAYLAYGGPLGKNEVKAGREYGIRWNAGGNLWGLYLDGGMPERFRAVQDYAAGLLSGMRRTFVTGGGSGAETFYGDSDTMNITRNGTRVAWIQPSTNTDPDPKLAIVTRGMASDANAGVFTIREGNSGGIGAGRLIGGVRYAAEFRTPGNNYFLTEDGADHNYLMGLRGTFQTAGGTANAIILTDIRSLQPGMEVPFIPLATNTGPVTIAYGINGAIQVVKDANTALSGGEFVAGVAAKVIFEGSPGNKFRVLSNGKLFTTAGVVEGLNALAPLREKLTQKPYGSGRTYSGTVRTIVKQILGVLGVGNSLGLGAGGDTDRTPLLMLRDALIAQTAGYAGFDIQTDNRSVGGTTMSQYAAQYSASTLATKTLCLIVCGTNDFPSSNFNSGQTLTGGVNALITLIKQAVADGFIPIVATAAHLHPARYTNGIGENPLIYPFSAFNVTLPYTFSTADQSIYHASGFNEPTFGGPDLKAGAVVKTYAGSNQVAHTITGRSSDGTKIFVNGTITTNVTESVLLRHINVDLETVMIPPDSTAKPIRDWTGNGVTVQGDARFWVGNNAIRDAVRTYGGMLLDIEQAAFRFVETAPGGWDDFYGPTNSNHPINAGYDGVWKPAIQTLVKQLLREQIYGGVIR